MVESPHFINYTHFVKLDENINIIRPLPNNIFNNINYAGKVQYYQGNRRWHFGKCSSNNKYYNIEYQGEFVPWCKGGYGYIISRTAINLIKDNQDFTNHIYEDLYLGLILREKNILPTPIKTELFFIPSRRFKHFFNSSRIINSSTLCACSIDPGPHTTVLIPIS